MPVSNAEASDTSPPKIAPLISMLSPLVAAANPPWLESVVDEECEAGDEKPPIPTHRLSKLATLPPVFPNGCLKASSIASKLWPLVSGMYAQSTSIVVKQNPPNKKYAPKLEFAKNIGVRMATSQLVKKPRPWATQFAEDRVAEGWISEA